MLMYELRKKIYRARNRKENNNDNNKIETTRVTDCRRTMLDRITELDIYGRIMNVTE